MAKATTRVKGKKKRWFHIIAPKSFREQPVGEIHLYEPSKAIGRTVKINLTNLTGDMKRQNISIRFRINNVGEGKLYTEVIGYEMMTTAVKRMVRRRSSKVMLSFLATTADNKTIRIKPILLTRGKTKQSIMTSLRRSAQEFINEEAKKLNLSNLIENLVNHRFQVGLKKYLSKIYPVRIVEVKELREVEKEKPEITPKKIPEETPKEPEKPKKKLKKKEPKKETKPKTEKTSG